MTKRQAKKLVCREAARLLGDQQPDSRMFDSEEDYQRYLRASSDLFWELTRRGKGVSEDDHLHHPEVR